MPPPLRPSDTLRAHFHGWVGMNPKHNDQCRLHWVKRLLHWTSGLILAPKYTAFHNTLLSRSHMTLLMYWQSTPPRSWPLPPCLQADVRQLNFDPSLLGPLTNDQPLLCVTMHLMARYAEHDSIASATQDELHHEPH